jgi:hypothetical protein
MVQVKFTAAGKAEPAGVVVKFNVTLVGVPPVIDTVPGAA